MKRILVVDDNADNRSIIAQMLKLSGYDVECATNGQAALQVAATKRPDLIMMDMAMPVLDGWNTTQLLKAQPETAHVPVIAVTGHATSDDLQRAKLAGCDDYLIKPIDFEVMLHKVRMYLA
jgi:CheY-like chemotaxis protein